MPGTCAMGAWLRSFLQRTLCILGCVHSESGFSMLQCERLYCTVCVSGVLVQKCCIELWFDEDG